MTAPRPLRWWDTPPARAARLHRSQRVDNTARLTVIAGCMVATVWTVRIIRHLTEGARP